MGKRGAHGQDALVCEAVRLRKQRVYPFRCSSLRTYPTITDTRLLSQDAWTAGAFTTEIAPVTLSDPRKGDTIISEDEEYKKILPAKVPSLKPVFSKTGTVTAANASNLNDGASALILASQNKVDELGLKPLARIVCTF